MALTKEQKGKIYEQYMALLSRAQGMIITEYRGMQMTAVNAIRKTLRPVDGSFNVVKNTIFRIALAENGFAAPKELLSGPVAVAIAYSDVAKLTKTVIGIKDQPLLILKGAIMGRSVFQADQLEALSTMPTLDEARATLVGTLQSPATSLMALIGTPGQQFANILKAYSDKLEGGGEAA